MRTGDADIAGHSATILMRCCQKGCRSRRPRVFRTAGPALGKFARAHIQPETAAGESGALDIALDQKAVGTRLEPPDREDCYTHRPSGAQPALGSVTLRRPVAFGASRKRGHMARTDCVGVLIGSFFAHEDAEYFLSLVVKNVNPEWDSCTPQVEIKVNPVELESLIFYQLFGLMIAVPCGGVLLIIGAVRSVVRGLRAKKTG